MSDPRHVLWFCFTAANIFYTVIEPGSTCRFNKRETIAALKHLNVGHRGKAAELAGRLFEATAVARKAHDLTRDNLKKDEAPETASGKGCGRGRGGQAHGSGKGRGRLGGKAAWPAATSTDNERIAASAPAGGAASASGAGKGRGRGRCGQARGTGRGRGRQGGKAAEAPGAAKRDAPVASISPGQHKTRRRQPQGQASKRPRGSPLKSSPTLSPPLRKSKSAEAPKPNGTRCLFPVKRVQVTDPPSTITDSSSSDDEVPLAHRAVKPVQEKPEVVESGSSGEDDAAFENVRAKPVVLDESDDSSDENDIPLAHRVLPADYTWDMLTVQPKTFAVTAAGENNPADECSFTFHVARGKLSLPMHYVEVLELDPVKRMVHWQFWLPRAGHLTATSKNTYRTFKRPDMLFKPEAFRRGGQRHRGWYPFSPNEVLTCWDDRLASPMGGIPDGEEKREFLKVVAENTQ